MKKLTLVSLAAATFLFVGCGDDKKATSQIAETAQIVEEATAEITEAAVETTQEAVEAVKEVAEEAVEATKEVVADTIEAVEGAAQEAGEKAEEAVEEAAQEASEKAEEAVEEAAEEAEEAAEAAEGAAGAAQGKALYATCASCHGPDGKTLALGKGALLAGQSKDDLASKMREYKNGTRDVAGNGMLMKGQMAALSDSDIDALAEYITTF
ncbi:MAG TPA: c-type cytochrome [Epsilonproteobacteria bacterium]|nr:c-type cytochrome [Campylobacterota bacterium]